MHTFCVTALTKIIYTFVTGMTVDATSNYILRES